VAKVEVNSTNAQAQITSNYEHSMKRNAVIRNLTVSNVNRTAMIESDVCTRNPWDDWWYSFILGRNPLNTSGILGSVSVIDLFGSAGGLSLGIREAIRAFGYKMNSLSAVDLDVDALGTYETNFSPRRIFGESVSNLVDYRVVGLGAKREFAYEPAALKGMVEFTGVDLLVGGPPCQGHSSLNNLTRGQDDRNDLYLVMPALAIALNAKSVVIENVPRVVHDKGQVVQAAEKILRNAGYYLSSGVLKASELGWPQTRSRHFLIASKTNQPKDVKLFSEILSETPRPLSWLIQSLEERFNQGDPILDTVPKMSADNVRRVNWLFENNQYDLINSERPKCHQDGHTYPSVYGRLKYDSPAPTLTTGFQTPGRGRHVHPTQRRVLTIREAARIQGFPDSFQFVNEKGEPASRGNMQKWIGDAVPSILGYVAGLIALEAML